MKRILSLCLVCLLMLLSGLTVHAEGVTVSAGSASAAVGESFTVPITLSGNTGFSNLGIEIEYDASAMTLQSAQGNSNVGAIFTPAQSIDTMPYNMGWDSTSNNGYNGEIAQLRFVALKSGTYTISVSFYKGRNGGYEDGSDVNYNEDFAPLGLAYENGSVTISGGGAAATAEPTEPPFEPSGAYVRLGAARGAAGETVELPLELHNNTGFANLGVELSYDSSVLTLVSAEANTSAGAIFTPAQSIDTMPYNMGWDSTANNSFNGTLATLKFKISDTAAAGKYTIDVSYYKGRNGTYTDGEDVNYDDDFKSLELSYFGGSINIAGSFSENAITIKNSVRNNDSLQIMAAITSSEIISGLAAAAVYDKNGRLLALDTMQAQQELKFSFANLNDARKCCVLWWTGLKEAKPLALADEAVIE